MIDRIGQQLGNYRLIHFLGRGGYAEVYLGEHLFLKTQAAIKVLNVQLADENFKDFLNEAQLIASLDHPHIVRVLEFGVEGRTPYLVMTYAPNGTMRHLFPKGSSLAPERILPYLKQVVEALQYAHDRKIIHRDVKPENMLLGRNNEVLLGDFGVSLIVQSSRDQSTQESVGTMPYMAPEQLRGRPRRASDQYALGITVYEWLSGDVPFRGSLSSIMRDHLETPPPSLRMRVPTLSPEIEQVVMKALAKDRRDRYPNVSTFVAAFEQACQQPFDHTIAASPWNRPQRVPGAIGPLPDRTLLASETVDSYSDRPPSPLPAAAVAAPGPGGWYNPPPRPKSRISRRTLLLGLGAVAGLAALGTGIAWLVQPHSQAQSQPPASTSTTSPRLGTTLYTYKGHTNSVLAVAWSPNGKRIVSGSLDHMVQVWDATTGDHVLPYSGHTDGVEVVAWSPNGKYIASAGKDRTVQVWDATNGNLIVIYKGHTQTVLTLAWSHDSKYIASGSLDQTVQVWEATLGGQPLVNYTGHSDTVTAVGWSSNDKQIVSASYDKSVQIWEANTGNLVSTYSGHKDAVFTAAWSPDNKYIASGGSDQTVQVWEATTRHLIVTYSGHTKPVEAVTWAPNSKHLASASDDKTVQLWQATTGTHTFTYKGHSDAVYAVAWSSDGQHIASASFDKTVQVWQAV
jgi:WD40 repeat protein/tRNA A-37 threonylcarbamoyl transferase component Bud32